MLQDLFRCSGVPEALRALLSQPRFSGFRPFSGDRSMRVSVPVSIFLLFHIVIVFCSFCEVLFICFVYLFIRSGFRDFDPVSKKRL